MDKSGQKNRVKTRGGGRDGGITHTEGNESAN